MEIVAPNAPSGGRRGRLQDVWRQGAEARDRRVRVRFTETEGALLDRAASAAAWATGGWLAAVTESAAGHGPLPPGPLLAARAWHRLHLLLCRAAWWLEAARLAGAEDQVGRDAARARAVADAVGKRVAETGAPGAAGRLAAGAPIAALRIGPRSRRDLYPGPRERVVELLLAARVVAVVDAKAKTLGWPRSEYLAEVGLIAAAAAVASLNAGPAEGRLSEVETSLALAVDRLAVQAGRWLGGVMDAAALHAAVADASAAVADASNLLKWEGPGS